MCDVFETNYIYIYRERERRGRLTLAFPSLSVVIYFTELVTVGIEDGCSGMYA
jgi:hypothetical protein